MKIETKYDIGQEVWVMSIGRPFCTTIRAIRIDEIGLQYILKYISARDEKDIYSTKEELLKSL